MWWACRVQPRHSAEDVPEWHVDLGHHIDRIVLPRYEEGASVKEMCQELNEAIKRSREIGRGSARLTRPNYMQIDTIGLEPPTDAPAEDAVTGDDEVVVVERQAAGHPSDWVTGSIQEKQDLGYSSGQAKEGDGGGSSPGRNLGKNSPLRPL